MQWDKQQLSTTHQTSTCRDQTTLPTVGTLLGVPTTTKMTIGVIRINNVNEQRTQHWASSRSKSNQIHTNHTIQKEKNFDSKNRRKNIGHPRVYNTLHSWLHTLHNDNCCVAQVPQSPRQ
eukprot:5641213-Amphidinium_carterae.3